MCCSYTISLQYYVSTLVGCDNNGHHNAGIKHNNNALNKRIIDSTLVSSWLGLYDFGLPNNRRYKALKNVILGNWYRLTK